MTASTLTGASTCTQSSTAGPTMIPSTISSTTAGSRTRGTSDTSSGAASAIAVTASSEPYEFGTDTV
ncbi:MAG TPA: hypothetical protein VI462_09880 [Acidimicrobiia bacterium]